MKYKKKIEKLRKRQAAHAAMEGRGDSKVQQRYKAGGYRRLPAAWSDQMIWIIIATYLVAVAAGVALLSPADPVLKFPDRYMATCWLPLGLIFWVLGIGYKVCITAFNFGRKFDES